MTKAVTVGGVAMGGGAHVTIQSMTNTKTQDAAATTDQILALERAGCQIVRVSVYDEACALSLPAIREGIHIPLVADIHYDERLAILALEHGADKIRFNPGNLSSREKVQRLADCARMHHAPIRVGVNAGSLEPDLLRRFGGPRPEALIQSALRHVRLLEQMGFYDIVVSLKASNVPDTLTAYRGMRKLTDYPLHIGVTEAGDRLAGVVKSAIGIGCLLLEGIGDTLRVSLTGDPTAEVAAAKEILRAVGLRRDGLEIVACPTCGRCQVDLEEAVARVRERCPDTARPLKVAVMGCAVNGPGEAREADIGIAFGKGAAVVFRHGEKQYQGNMPGVLDRFLGDVEALAREPL